MRKIRTISSSLNLQNPLLLKCIKLVILDAIPPMSVKQPDIYRGVLKIKHRMWNLDFEYFNVQFVLYIAKKKKFNNFVSVSIICPTFQCIILR